MKSKPILSPQVKKRAHQYVDQQLCIERAYIAHCVLNGCAVALNTEFGFGKDRIQRFAAAAMACIQEYFDSDPDTWPDLAQRDCERIGLEFDHYWIKARDRDGNPAQLKVTPEQQKFLEDSRSILLSDEESKKIHSGWKAWK